MSQLIRSLLFSLAALAMVVAAVDIAVAQPNDGEEDMLSNMRTVYVSGSADTLVVPDEVLFIVAIETRHMKIDSARLMNEDKLRKLQDVMKKMKVSDADVRMDLLDLAPFDMVSSAGYTDFNPQAFPEDPDADKLREYFARRQIAITLRDLSRYTDFLAEMLKLDIDLLSSPQFRIADEERLQQALRIAAVRDARTKAQALAGELGMTVGDPISIGDYDYEYDYERDYGRSQLTGNASGGLSSSSPDRVELEASISINFEME